MPQMVELVITMVIVMVVGVVGLSIGQQAILAVETAVPASSAWNAPISTATPVPTAAPPAQESSSPRGLELASYGVVALAALGAGVAVYRIYPYVFGTSRDRAQSAAGIDSSLRSSAQSRVSLDELGVELDLVPARTSPQAKKEKEEPKLPEVPGKSRWESLE